MISNQYWQVHAFNPADKEFISDWENLSNLYHSNNQLLGVEFITELLHHFDHYTLYLAKAFEAGKLQCLMLLQKRKNFIWELYKPSQAQVALLLINPFFLPNLDTLVASMPANTARIDFHSLDPIEHLSLINVLKNEQLALYATNMRIQIGENFDQYWQARSKNLRKNMSRYENRLVRDNITLKFCETTCPEQVLAAVDRYGMLESQGWKGNKGTALHPSNNQGQFYRAFLHRLAIQKKAIIYEFYIQDRLVASRLCCIKQDMLIILKTTYDENFKNYALGRLLLKRILSSLFSRKLVKIVDFYTNASPEQLEWSTEQRSMYDASMYANNISGLLLSSVAKIKQRLKASVRAVGRKEDFAN